MKKLTAEQLSAHLAHGEWVAMKEKDGDWKVFMYETADGRFQGTYLEETIEQSLSNGLVSGIFSPVEIENYFTDYEIIKRPPALMKKGDNCQIIDSPKLRGIAENSWWESRIDMIGQKGLEIKETADEYYIFNKNKSDWHAFPLWAVARDFSEELELSDEELLAEVKRRGLLENK